MKKIFAIFAMVAVVLGMASCGQKWENEDYTKRFEITISNLTATSVQVHIVAPTPDTRFSWALMPKSMCAYSDAGTLASKLDADGTGECNEVVGHYPGLEYVLYVYEKGEKEGERIGELEYIFFTAPDQREASFSRISYNGVVSIGTPGEGASYKLLMIEAADAKEDTKVRLNLVANALTGTFSTDQIFYYWLFTSGVTTRKVSGDPNSETDTKVIYKAEFKGEYDSDYDLYVYTGEFVCINDQYTSSRIPFVFKCKKAQ